MAYLDYVIHNSRNNDGLVLFKPGGELHETHLGNYGEGSEENILACKKDAIIHFMIARPHIFAQSILNKVKKPNSGTVHEYYLLINTCKAENIEIPEDITCEGSNGLIHFNGWPLY